MSLEFGSRGFAGKHAQMPKVPQLTIFSDFVFSKVGYTSLYSHFPSLGHNIEVMAKREKWNTILPSDSCLKIIWCAAPLRQA